jgi:hypothetical protein
MPFMPRLSALSHPPSFEPNIFQKARSILSTSGINPGFLRCSRDVVFFQSQSSAQCRDWYVENHLEVPRSCLDRLVDSGACWNMNGAMMNEIGWVA